MNGPQPDHYSWCDDDNHGYERPCRRAALIHAPAPEPTGLDAERLALALSAVHQWATAEDGKPTPLALERAGDIIREYARLVTEADETRRG